MPTPPDPSAALASHIAAGRDIVFYDGECALCHATVRFFLRRDRDASRFVFAPLGGATFAESFGPGEPLALPDSVVVRTSANRWLVQSSAVAWLLKRLGGLWSVPGQVLVAVPAGLADSGYALVARARRSMSGRPDDWCPVPEGPERARFLP